jgi:hypothetical protein
VGRRSGIAAAKQLTFCDTKIMESRLEKFERRLAAAREFERLKKYLSLFGIGFALWINDLWNYALVLLKIGEEKLDNWFFRLFSDAHPKVSPVLEFFNTVSFILFLAFSVWLIYWAYMDTYVRTARGERTWSFSKKCLFGALVNTVTYIVLYVATF